MKINVLDKYRVYKSTKICYEETFHRPCPSFSKFKFGKIYNCIYSEIVDNVGSDTYVLVFIEDYTSKTSLHLIATPIDLSKNRVMSALKVSDNVEKWFKKNKEEYNERGNINE